MPHRRGILDGRNHTEAMTLMEWKTRAEAISDSELAGFRGRVCVGPGHVGTCAIGRCARCRGSTSSSSMQICEGCAEELGVCPFDQRLTGWGSVSAPDAEAIAACWLALLMRGYAAEREAARKALQEFPLPGLAAAVAELEREPGAPPRSPTRAAFIVGFAGRIPEELSAGAPFLNGTITGVNGTLACVVAETPDAAVFEEQAAAHPGVRYAERNWGS